MSRHNMLLLKYSVKKGGRHWNTSCNHLSRHVLIFVKTIATLYMVCALRRTFCECEKCCACQTFKTSLHWDSNLRHKLIKGLICLQICASKWVDLHGFEQHKKLWHTTRYFYALESKRREMCMLNKGVMSKIFIEYLKSKVSINDIGTWGYTQNF